MDAFLIALAGGVSGVVLTRLLDAARVRGDVARNDLEAAELNRHLGQWAADDTLVVARKRQEATDELNNAGVLFSGATLVRLAHVHTKALQRWRDQAAITTLQWHKLRAAEGVAHQAWRKLRDQPFPELHVLAEVEPILDHWRAPERIGSDSQEPIDPTRRDLAAAIAELPSKATADVATDEAADPPAPTGPA